MPEDKKIKIGKGEFTLSEIDSAMKSNGLGIQYLPSIKDTGVGSIQQRGYKKRSKALIDNPDFNDNLSKYSQFDDDSAFMAIQQDQTFSDRLGRGAAQFGYGFGETIAQTLPGAYELGHTVIDQMGGDDRSFFTNLGENVANNKMSKALMDWQSEGMNKNRIYDGVGSDTIEFAASMGPTVGFIASFYMGGTGSIRAVLSSLIKGSGIVGKGAAIAGKAGAVAGEVAATSGKLAKTFQVAKTGMNLVGRTLTAPVVAMDNVGQFIGRTAAKGYNLIGKNAIKGLTGLEKEQALLTQANRVNAWGDNLGHFIANTTASLGEANLEAVRTIHEQTIPALVREQLKIERPDLDVDNMGYQEVLYNVSKEGFEKAKEFGYNSAGKQYVLNVGMLAFTNSFGAFQLFKRNRNISIFSNGAQEAIDGMVKHEGKWIARNSLPGSKVSAYLKHYIGGNAAEGLEEFGQGWVGKASTDYALAAQKYNNDKANAQKGVNAALSATSMLGSFANTAKEYATGEGFKDFLTGIAHSAILGGIFGIGGTSFRQFNKNFNKQKDELSKRAENLNNFINNAETPNTLIYKAITSGKPASINQSLPISMTGIKNMNDAANSQDEFLRSDAFASMDIGEALMILDEETRNTTWKTLLDASAVGATSGIKEQLEQMKSLELSEKKKVLSDNYGEDLASFSKLTDNEFNSIIDRQINQLDTLEEFVLGQHPLSVNIGNLAEGLYNTYRDNLSDDERVLLTDEKIKEMRTVAQNEAVSVAQGLLFNRMFYDESASNLAKYMHQIDMISGDFKVENGQQLKTVEEYNNYIKNNYDTGNPDSIAQLLDEYEKKINAATVSLMGINNNKFVSEEDKASNLRSQAMSTAQFSNIVSKLYSSANQMLSTQEKLNKALYGIRNYHTYFTNTWTRDFLSTARDLFRRRGKLYNDSDIKSLMNKYYSSKHSAKIDASILNKEVELKTIVLNEIDALLKKAATTSEKKDLSDKKESIQNEINDLNSRIGKLTNIASMQFDEFIVENGNTKSRELYNDTHKAYQEYYDAKQKLQEFHANIREIEEKKKLEEDSQLVETVDENLITKYNALLDELEAAQDKMNASTNINNSRQDKEFYKFVDGKSPFAYLPIDSIFDEDIAQNPTIAILKDNYERSRAMYRIKEYVYKIMQKNMEVQSSIAMKVLNRSETLDSNNSAFDYVVSDLMKNYIIEKYSLDANGKYNIYYNQNSIFVEQFDDTGIAKVTVISNTFRPDIENIDEFIKGTIDASDKVVLDDTNSNTYDNPKKVDIKYKNGESESFGYIINKNGNQYFIRVKDQEFAESKVLVNENDFLLSEDDLIINGIRYNIPSYISDLFGTKGLVVKSQDIRDLFQKPSGSSVKFGKSSILLYNDSEAYIVTSSGQFVLININDIDKGTGTIVKNQLHYYKLLRELSSKETLSSSEIEFKNTSQLTSYDDSGVKPTSKEYNDAISFSDKIDLYLDVIYTILENKDNKELSKLKLELQDNLKNILKRFEVSDKSYISDSLISSKLNELVFITSKQIDTVDTLDDAKSLINQFEEAITIALGDTSNINFSANETELMSFLSNQIESILYTIEVGNIIPTTTIMSNLDQMNSRLPYPARKRNYKERIKNLSNMQIHSSQNEILGEAFVNTPNGVLDSYIFSALSENAKSTLLQASNILGMSAAKKFESVKSLPIKERLNETNALIDIVTQLDKPLIGNMSILDTLKSFQDTKLTLMDQSLGAEIDGTIAKIEELQKSYDEYLKYAQSMELPIQTGTASSLIQAVVNMYNELGNGITPVNSVTTGNKYNDFIQLFSSFGDRFDSADLSKVIENFKIGLNTYAVDLISNNMGANLLNINEGYLKSSELDSKGQLIETNNVYFNTVISILNTIRIAKNKNIDVAESINTFAVRLKSLLEVKNNAGDYAFHPTQQQVMSLLLTHLAEESGVSINYSNGIAGSGKTYMSAMKMRMDYMRNPDIQFVVIGKNKEVLDKIISISGLDPSTIKMQIVDKGSLSDLASIIEDNFTVTSDPATGMEITEKEISVIVDEFLYVAEKDSAVFSGADSYIGKNGASAKFFLSGDASQVSTLKDINQFGHIAGPGGISSTIESGTYVNILPVLTYSRRTNDANIGLLDRTIKGKDDLLTITDVETNQVFTGLTHIKNYQNQSVNPLVNNTSNQTELRHNATYYVDTNFNYYETGTASNTMFHGGVKTYPYGTDQIAAVEESIDSIVRNPANSESRIILFLTDSTRDEILNNPKYSDLLKANRLLIFSNNDSAQGLEEDFVIIEKDTDKPQINPDSISTKITRAIKGVVITGPISYQNQEESEDDGFSYTVINLLYKSSRIDGDSPASAPVLSNMEAHKIEYDSLVSFLGVASAIPLVATTPTTASSSVVLNDIESSFSLIESLIIGGNIKDAYDEVNSIVSLINSYINDKSNSELDSAKVYEIALKVNSLIDSGVFENDNILDYATIKLDADSNGILDYTDPDNPKPLELKFNMVNHGYSSIDPSYDHSAIYSFSIEAPSISDKIIDAYAEQVLKMSYNQLRINFSNIRKSLFYITDSTHRNNISEKLSENTLQYSKANGFTFDPISKTQDIVFVVDGNIVSREGVSQKDNKMIATFKGLILDNSNSDNISAQVQDKIPLEIINQEVKNYKGSVNKFKPIIDAIKAISDSDISISEKVLFIEKIVNSFKIKNGGNFYFFGNDENATSRSSTNELVQYLINNDFQVVELSDSKLINENIENYIDLIFSHQNSFDVLLEEVNKLTANKIGFPSAFKGIYPFSNRKALLTYIASLSNNNKSKNRIKKHIEATYKKGHDNIIREIEDIFKIKIERVKIEESEIIDGVIEESIESLFTTDSSGLHEDDEIYDQTQKDEEVEKKSNDVIKNTKQFRYRDKVISEDEKIPGGNNTFIKYQIGEVAFQKYINYLSVKTLLDDSQGFKYLYPLFLKEYANKKIKVTDDIIRIGLHDNDLYFYLKVDDKFILFAGTNIRERNEGIPVILEQGAPERIKATSVFGEDSYIQFDKAIYQYDYSGKEGSFQVLDNNTGGKDNYGKYNFGEDEYLSTKEESGNKPPSGFVFRKFNEHFWVKSRKLINVNKLIEGTALQTKAPSEFWRVLFGISAPLSHEDFKKRVDDYESEGFIFRYTENGFEINDNMTYRLVYQDNSRSYYQVFNGPSLIDGVYQTDNIVDGAFVRVEWRDKNYRYAKRVDLIKSTDNQLIDGMRNSFNNDDTNAIYNIMNAFDKDTGARIYPHTVIKNSSLDSSSINVFHTIKIESHGSNGWFNKNMDIKESLNTLLKSSPIVKTNNGKFRVPVEVTSVMSYNKIAAQSPVAKIGSRTVKILHKQKAGEFVVHKTFNHLYDSKEHYEAFSNFIVPFLNQSESIEVYENNKAGKSSGEGYPNVILYNSYFKVFKSEDDKSVIDSINNVAIVEIGMQENESVANNSNEGDNESGGLTSDDILALCP